MTKQKRKNEEIVSSRKSRDTNYYIKKALFFAYLSGFLFGSTVCGAMGVEAVVVCVVILYLFFVLYFKEII